MSFGTKSAGDKGTSAWANLIENALGDGNPASAADWLIFKSGSTYYARNGLDGTIDYSGTAAHTIVNSAIGSGEETLYFLSGTYNFTSPIQYYGNTSLIGAKGAILQNDGSGNLIENVSSGTLRNRVVVKDLNIYLAATGSCGIDFHNVCLGVIGNCYIVRTGGVAGTRYAIRLDSTGSAACYFNVLINNDVDGVESLKSGLEMEGEASWTVNNNQVIGGRYQRCTQNIYMKYTGYNYLANPDVEGGTDGFVSGGYNQLNKFNLAHFAEQSSNNVELSTNDYTGSQICKFVDCTFDGTLTNTGYAKFKRCYGFVTENSGTSSIASGNTSVAITHGLSITPSAQHISIIGMEDPTNAVGTVWVDNIGSTTFQVNVENDPGASNWDFGWKVVAP